MKKKTCKLIARAFAVLFCLTLLPACGKDTANTKVATKVTLNEVAHSIFYAPMYVAIENGYFAEEGIDLTLVTGFGADKTMTALLTGEADIAGNFVVSRTPIDNFSFDMLIGKNVLGGRPGGMPEMVFEYILLKNNIDPSQDLSIDQSIDFGSTAAAFSGGQGDFTIEFEPHATALEEKGDGFLVASLGEASGYVPYTAFSAKKSYIKEHPDTIQAFTNALQKGMDYTASHTPEEIAKVISPQFPETDMDTLITIVTRYHDQNTWKEDLIFTEDAFVLLENILKESKVLDDFVPYEDLVTTEFAEKAK